MAYGDVELSGWGHIGEGGGMQRAERGKKKKEHR
jgi:hypothetical protein